MLPAADTFIPRPYAASPCIPDRHAAAAFTAEKDSRKKGGSFPGRAAAFRVCAVRIKTFLVFLEFLPGNISRMVVRDKDLPVVPVCKPDRMMGKMTVRMDGFVVTVTAIDIGTCIGRVMYGCKDTAVDKRAPGDLPVPHTAIGTLGKRKIVFRKITDNTVRAS